MDLENVEALGDWDKWKHTLSNAVNLGKTVGFTEKTINNIGYRVGDFLSSNIDPENREQRLLHELWKSGDDEDRKALSKMIVKMVQNDENIERS